MLSTLKSKNDMNIPKIEFRFPGLFTTLGVVFIILKLIGTINWSWWWVLLPIYGPLGITVICALILAIVYYIISKRYGGNKIWQ